MSVGIDVIINCGTGGWEYAQQTAKYTFDTKNIYICAWKHAQLLIKFKSSQHQVSTIVILNIFIEYLVQNCACVRVCVIFVLIVVFHKLHFIKDMGGIMLKEALFFVCLFFVFFRFS